MVPPLRLPRALALATARLMGGSQQLTFSVYYFALQPIMDSLLLTAQQVGERYGLHRNTLYAWEQQGLLHPVRTPGGRRRYRRDGIERLLTLEP